MSCGRKYHWGWIKEGYTRIIIEGKSAYHKGKRRGRRETGYGWRAEDTDEGNNVSTMYFLTQL